MLDGLIVTLGSAVSVLWLVVCLACPRKPQRPDELAELAYARLAGRRDRFALVACVATALLASLFAAWFMRGSGHGA